MRLILAAALLAVSSTATPQMADPFDGITPHRLDLDKTCPEGGDVCSLPRDEFMAIIRANQALLMRLKKATDAPPPKKCAELKVERNT